METASYTDVLLPLPLEVTFTYKVPIEWMPQLKVGCRVLVPFGNRKQMTGIVQSIHNRPPATSRIKDILKVLDESPFLGERDFSFWSWIAGYYCCTTGEVLNAALPAALRPASADDDKWQLRLERREVYVRMNPLYESNSLAVDTLLLSMARAKKQVVLLRLFMQLTDTCVSEEGRRVVSRKTLLNQAESTPATLKLLCERGVLDCYEEICPKQAAEPTMPLPTLTSYQKTALDDLKQQLDKHAVCLLHGYTSSGKTALYLHLIHQCIEEGSQALFLVPEIALTTQLADRLKQVFGSTLGIYHSGLSERDRLEVWRQLRQEDGFNVILGVRSSIFLPFRKLGLVVVDEEHDSSYKQQDPAPRYHARNAALVLASMHGAKTVLGSATPSLESYARCHMGQYGLTELFHRYADTQLPEVIAVDVKDLKRRKKMKSILSPPLIEAMQTALEANEQIILFQNRRGFAPLITCRVCDWVPKCPRCDVALTYHKHLGRLTCHYCGLDQEVPSVCPSCGEPKPASVGFGTEQVEEEVHRLFSDVSTLRLDTDTSRSLAACTGILKQFQAGKAQVLIGTQLVSKGLDFSRVRLVGILNADQMLSFPDFRSHERAFQLMAQVGGRGGRRDQRGLVIIQTSHPDNPVVQQVVNQDYIGFFNEEMAVRQLFAYPPYTRFIHLSIRDVDFNVVKSAAEFFAQRCVPVFGDRVLGPDKPAVSRIRNQHRQSVYIKLDITLSVTEAKQFLYRIREEMKRITAYRSVQVVFDIDPV